MALVVLGAGAGRAGEPTIPASWQGVWTVTTIERECGDPTIVDEYTEPDTLCAGQRFYSEEGSVECTGTVDDSGADITCTYTEEIDPVEFPGCTVTFTATIVAERTSPTTYEALETISIDFSDECGPFFQDSCIEYTTTGTLTSEDPECTVPVESSTWGRIKSLYR
jgi:hypothetical protein